jgi:aminobenzoyl-glutamate utilization protein B
MDNAKTMEQVEIQIKAWFDKNQDWIIDLSKQIWELAEVKFEEFRSSKLLSSTLEQYGFTIKTEVVNGLPTAFIAEWSNGKGPVIATLGEYDALPGLGYEIADTKKSNGKNGHGCGHNLLGVGSLAAIVAVQEAMKALNIEGTLRYYGCPAEEGGAAKVFMVRDGLFKGIDAIVRWHPINATYVSMAPSLAMYSIRYQFHGKTAHAGVNPHLGRSALDAAILMDVGVNYLREHITPNIRIHSVITQGGAAPNIVPDFAEIWYYIRAPKKVEVDEVVVRMEKIATGMAMATETSVEIKITSASSEILPNQAICDRMLINLKRVGPPQFTDEEKAFAKKLNEGLSSADKAKSMLIYGIRDPKVGEKDLYDEISDNMTAGMITPYSSDSGDVSWQAPTGQVFVAGQTIGTANHSWQQVVCSGMSIGQKGMLCAAKTMALTAVDILTDPVLLAAAKEEYEHISEMYPYKCPLPQDLKPGAY